MPFIAVASAGVANMLLMRRKEAFDGVKVYTKDGRRHAPRRAVVVWRARMNRGYRYPPTSFITTTINTAAATTTTTTTTALE